jgi:NADPH-dependent 2,4-dienoyl-CoA reductase/sulfur reductase-like enzyme
MNIDRRNLLKLLGAAGALSIAPVALGVTAKPHVVVVGGGFAGATLAKYLRMWSRGDIEVTLIDRNASHTSCVMSNLVLNGRIGLDALRLPYDNLAARHGVNVIRDSVTEIEPDRAAVHLKSGDWIAFDRLVLATGIAFDKLPGTDFGLTPHAWIAGGNTRLLARQVASLGAGSTFVMTVPKAPYRCPPGPYERACLVADILARKGLGDGNAKVVVLDENPSIQAERHTFERAFEGIYRNIIEYVPNAVIGGVSSAERLVETSLGDYRGDVVNLIPRQRAPGLVRRAGLCNPAGWADVDPLTYASVVEGMHKIHVIGDIQGTGQPKSAHMANSQAKVCADAIIRSLAGLPTDSDERVGNVTTNSACYSPITYDQASWLTANFAYDESTGTMRLTQLGEAERWSRGSYREMFAWAENLFSDSFN